MKDNYSLPEIPKDVTGGMRIFCENIRSYLANYDKEVNESFSSVLPVGFIYFQLPGESAPGDLFTGTWTDVSSDFPGVFMRIEGGDASAFESGNQAQGTKLPIVDFTTGNQSASHSHTAGNQDTSHSHTAGNQSASHSHTAMVGNESASHTHGVSAHAAHHHFNGVGSAYGACMVYGSTTTGIPGYAIARLGEASGLPSYQGYTGDESAMTHTVGNQTASHNHVVTNGNQSASHSHTLGNQSASHSHTLGNQDTDHSHTITGGGDTETRPVNITIKIWKRTA